MGITDVEAMELQNLPEREWGRINRYRARAVRENCGDGPVLDAGAASDAYQEVVTAMGNDVVGLDLRLLSSSFAFVQGSVAELPFRSRSFETALLFEVLEHVPEPMKALVELSRVSDSLILTVPNCELGRAFAMAGLAPFHYTDASHVNFFTPETIVALLAEAGWNAISVETFGGMSPEVLLLGWLRLPGRLLRLLAAVFRRIPGRPGSSIMVVAHAAVGMRPRS